MRCHIEGCQGARTRDTPLCADHWRALPEALRSEWLTIARRVVAAAEACTEGPTADDRIEATCDPVDGVRHAIDPTRCPGDCRRCTGCARCLAPAT